MYFRYVSGCSVMWESAELGGFVRSIMPTFYAGPSRRCQMAGPGERGVDPLSRPARHLLEGCAGSLRCADRSAGCERASRPPPGEEEGTMRPRNAPIAWMALVGVVLAAPSLAADVHPGEVLTKGDIPRLGSLVSPSIEWILRRGATMKI